MLIGTLPPLAGRAEDAGAPRGAADTESREPPAAAIDHYKKGRELYLAGRYREAVVELEQAVALDPDSLNLVYNLARVYELLGEIDTSIRHYKRYRELLPPTELEERARVTGILQRLEGARTHAPPEEPQREPEPPPPLERGVADATFWTFTVGSAGALVAGAALGVMALNTEKDAKRFVLDADNDIIERKAIARRANRLALSSDVSLLAGAILGTTAILLYALRQKPAPAKAAPRAALDVGAGPSGAFLVLRGRL